MTSALRGGGGVSPKEDVVCVCIDRTLYMQATAFSQLRLLIQKERTISQYF